MKTLFPLKAYILFSAGLTLAAAMLIPSMLARANNNNLVRVVLGGGNDSYSNYVASAASTGGLTDGYGLEVFDDTLVATSFNYGGYTFEFFNPAYLTDICLYNGSNSGDYAHSWELWSSDTGDSSSWTKRDGPVSASLNATVCLAGGGAGPYKYWRISQGNGTPAWRAIKNVVITGYDVPPATATPTPANIATSVPQGAMPCITGTVNISPTVRATMTPFRSTGTPAPTRTPGGPTPTATAPITATHTAISATVGYDSGLIAFNTDVSMLAAHGDVNSGAQPMKFLHWSSVTGQDGQAGVAWLHNHTIGVGSNGMTATVAEADGAAGMIAFSLPVSYSGAIAVSWYARTAYTMTVGNSHFMRIWYLDPNYDGLGNPMWVTYWSDPIYGADPVGPTAGGLAISNDWRKFGYAVTAPAGHQIAAIGFDDYYYGPDYPGDPCVDYGCVYMNDLRLAYGDNTSTVLPYCPGTDPRLTSSTNSRRGTKNCVTTITTIDLRAVCVAPTTLDLGAWLSYLWCNIWRFFGFFTENRDQIDAIITRQGINEPFGSLLETGTVWDDLSAKIDELRASNKDQAQTPIDWVRMMLDGSALDRPAQFYVPDIASAQTYLANCPTEAMFSDVTASGACMALYMMRQTIIVSFLQWGLNALFVVGVLMMIRGDLDKLSS